MRSGSTSLSNTSIEIRKFKKVNISDNTTGDSNDLSLKLVQGQCKRWIVISALNV